MNNHSRAFAPTAGLLAGLLSVAGAQAMAADGIELSGQVNRALMFADNGDQSKGFFADNDSSGTRFRMKGKKEINPNLEGGFLIELGYGSNASSAVNFANPSVSAEIAERHIDMYLGGNFGTVYLGQGDGAANGAMEEDLSGTGLVNYSNMTDLGGGIGFGNGGPAIGSTMGNQDFESRYDRVRYNSPSLGPVKIAASYGTKGGNDVYELAARPSMKIGSGQLAAAVGYSLEKTGGVRGDEQTTGFSLSYLMSSGLNGTVAYSVKGDDTPGASDSKYTYVKVGYKTGPHAVAVDYGIGSDFAADGDDSSAYGIGYVYTAAKWIELYAAAKMHTLDRDGADFDDVTIVTAGSRIKF